MDLLSPQHSKSGYSNNYFWHYGYKTFIYCLANYDTALCYQYHLQYKELFILKHVTRKMRSGNCVSYISTTGTVISKYFITDYTLINKTARCTSLKFYFEMVLFGQSLDALRHNYHDNEWIFGESRHLDFHSHCVGCTLRCRADFWRVVH